MFSYIPGGKIFDRRLDFRGNPSSNSRVKTTYTWPEFWGWKFHPRPNFSTQKQTIEWDIQTYTTTNLSFFFPSIFFLKWYPKTLKLRVFRHLKNLTKQGSQKTQKTKGQLRGTKNWVARFTMKRSCIGALPLLKNIGVMSWVKRLITTLPKVCPPHSFTPCEEHFYFDQQKYKWNPFKVSSPRVYTFQQTIPSKLDSSPQLQNTRLKNNKTLSTYIHHRKSPPPNNTTTNVTKTAGGWWRKGKGWGPNTSQSLHQLPMKIWWPQTSVETAIAQGARIIKGWISFGGWRWLS